MANALFIGRFQPFHVGHLDAMQQIYDAGFSHIVIAIGSSQYSRTVDNPLSYEERISTIESVLAQSNITWSYTFVPVPDIHEDAGWVNHVQTCIAEAGQSFDTAFSGNENTLELMEQANIPTQRVAMRKHISATQIRAMAREHDDSWREFIHPTIQDAVIGPIMETDPDL